MHLETSSQLRPASISAARRGWIGLIVIGLAACGGGGSGNSNSLTGGTGNPPNQSPGGSWTPGVYQPYASFAAQCAAPRTGINPNTGRAYPDAQGSVVTENNWLRSWTHHLYLWYSEVPDQNPANFSSPLDYFDVLKTSAVTPSGQPKDKFHFTYPTAEWEALSQSGVEAGYGVEWVAFSTTPPRRFVVAYTEPNSPAANAGVTRGAELLTVDGADFVNGNTQSIVDTLNAGLFPGGAGETHSFTIREISGATRQVSMTSTQVTRDPVPTVSTVQTASGPVGYLVFNDHIATSEQELIGAINTLRNANIQDLVLDLRYNGGGYLAIASELAYMIAGNVTAGRVFERMTFNDKHPTTNPVTGESLAPTPFYTSTRITTPTTNLPTLNLTRLYVITGGGTCSASESIMNALRGINFPVYQIGSTTCGKPYGFYAPDNCGTTYFSIQFKGQNEAGFGEYGDGFTPMNASASAAGQRVDGCSVADDFTRALGDSAEGRLAAALDYRAGGTCPAPSGSAPGTQLKAGQAVNAEGVLIRGPWRENRILTE